MLTELDCAFKEYLTKKSLFELKIYAVNTFTQIECEPENEISKCQAVFNEKLQNISQIHVISSTDLNLFHEIFKDLNCENIATFMMELKHSLNCLKSYLSEYEIIINLIEFISNPSDNSKVKLYFSNQENQEKSVTLRGHTRPIFCIQILSSSKIITGSGDNTIKIWDLQTRQCIGTLEGHQNAISHLKMSDDNLISVSVDKTIKLWDLNQGFCTKTLIGHQSLILCVKLLVNDILISGSFDKTIKVNDFLNQKI
jgi:WD40 repeat protein